MAQSRPSKAGLRPQDGCDTQGQVESLCVAVWGVRGPLSFVCGAHTCVSWGVSSRVVRRRRCVRGSVRL